MMHGEYCKTIYTLNLITITMMITLARYISGKTSTEEKLFF